MGEAEPPHKDWTDALARLLIEIKDAVESARNDSQSELEKDLQNDFLIRFRYDRITDRAEVVVRGSPSPKTVGLTAHNLLNRFVRNKAQVLSLMTNFTVPFDSNCAERDL